MSKYGIYIIILISIIFRINHRVKYNLNRIGFWYCNLSIIKSDNNIRDNKKTYYIST